MENRPLVVGKGSKEKIKTGVWRYRHNLGKDPNTGRYIYSPWRTIHTTKMSELYAAMEEYKLELNTGALVKKNHFTVGKYAEQFHALREGTMSPLAYKSEDLEVRHIIELFGDIQLSNLRSTHIKEAYAWARKEDRFSESTLSKIHTKLKQIMQEAVNDDLILKNPCMAIKVSRPRRKKRESLSQEDATRFQECLLNAKISSHVIAAYILLQTGVRRGEALGLTWEHVNLVDGSIEIVQQWAQDKELRAPKSDSSIRELSLSAEGVLFLEYWKRIQAKELKDVGLIQTGNTPVAHAIKECTPEKIARTKNAVEANFLDPDNFDRWFRDFSVRNGFGYYEKENVLYRVRKEGVKKTFCLPVDEYRARKAAGEKLSYVTTVKKSSGYRGLHPHMLRHTQATLLIGSNTDIKTVQARLGHANVQITLDIYSHIIKENDRAAAATFSGLLGGMHDAGMQLPPQVLELVEKSPDGTMQLAEEDYVQEAGPRTGVEAEQAIRAFVAETTGEFTKSQAAAACNITSAKWMSNALVKLQREGVIQKIGETRNIRYIRIKE